MRVWNRRTGAPEDAVYVGRPTKWGNPFRRGSREAVISRYKLWIVEQEHLLDALDELRGRDLVCWCAPEACHADVLLYLANLEPLRYARVLGWPVLPLAPGKKRPLGRAAPNGIYSASAEAARIADWWDDHPDAGVAIRTGGDLVVVDADGPTGLESARALRLPPTPSVKTPRGRHWYFRAPIPLRSSSGRLGPKIDVQAAKAYVVAPPSPGYRWRHDPFEYELAELPERIVRQLEANGAPGAPARKRSRSPSGDESRSGQDAREVIALLQEGKGPADVLAHLEEHSDKYAEKRARSRHEAQNYFESVLRWAQQWAAAEPARVVSATLETLAEAPGRPELHRVVLDLRTARGQRLRTKVAVGTAAWDAIRSGIVVSDPAHWRRVKTLEGRMLSVATRGGRVVWLRSP